MKLMILLIMLCNICSAQIKQTDSVKYDFDTIAGKILYWNGELKEYNGYLINDYQVIRKIRFFIGFGYLIRRNKILIRVPNDYVLKFIPK